MLEQLDRCREMAAKLAETSHSAAAGVVIAVVDEVAENDKYAKPLVDFMIAKCHVMLFRLLKLPENEQ